MKIKLIRSQVVRVPLEEPLAGGPAVFSLAQSVCHTSGRDGRRHRRNRRKLFRRCAQRDAKKGDGSARRIDVGEDPLRIDALTHKLCTAAASAGPGGILTLAISAIDMALWDIKGKYFGQSLGAMLGGLRERVPTYASGALVRAYAPDHLVKAAQRLVEAGFKQMKTQLALPGDTSPEKEVERARLMRAAVGPEIDLMCDINQRWSTHQAMDIGKRVEDVHFFWLEDVTVHDDYSGLARVADALATPLAGGECLYGITPFRHMIEAHSVDIIMIDLNRVGGISNWMKVAALAEAFNLPVVSHLLPEIHVHLISAIPNGLTVEYMPWSFRLFEEVPVPEKGELIVPTKPGLGLKFSGDIDRYVVG